MLRDVDSLTSTTGIVAMAAGGVAIIALATAITLAFSLRKVRRAQRVVLGDHNEDLVEHAAHLQTSFEALAGYVEDAARELNSRTHHAEQRLDRAIAHRALVRYDAYGEMSGQQSISLALLDTERNGFVISSIHHRDSARLYVKRIADGAGEFELSPEEDEAVKAALADEQHVTTAPDDESER